MTITTTEEAELLARISDFNGPTRRGAIIRSLAADRDAMRAENARLREALRQISNGDVCIAALTHPPICSRASAARAALGEKE